MQNQPSQLATEQVSILPTSSSNTRKNWTIPALEQFVITVATRNAGGAPFDDSDHAPARFS